MDELSLSDYNLVVNAVDLHDEFFVNTIMNNTMMKHIRRDMLRRMSYGLGYRKELPGYTMTGQEIEYLIVCLDECRANTQNPLVKTNILRLKKHYTELLGAVNKKESVELPKLLKNIQKQKAIVDKQISVEEFKIISSHRTQAQKKERIEKLKKNEELWKTYLGDAV